MVGGEGPSPSLVLSLVYRLPEDSMFVALARGGREHFGWTHDRHLLASIYDALNVNTRATGNWAKKAPDIPEWPRPKVAPAKRPEKAMTLSELHSRLMTRR